MKQYILVSLFFLFSLSSNAQTIETMVKGEHELTCRAYLHFPNGESNLSLIYSQAGSGVYSTKDENSMHSAVEHFFRQGKVAVLTMDKPGIQYDHSMPRDARVDDAIYNQHTQRDLVQCAENAIAWALGQPVIKRDADLYFVGHSEGSSVIARLLLQLLEKNSVLAKRVQLLLASGIPMSAWKDIIDFQLSQKDREEFWNAYARRDDKVLRHFGDLAYAYWQDILGTDPLIKTFELLADRQPATSIQFFQGLRDTNTIPAPVQEFETWNRQRILDEKPSLHLSARYYLGDHQLNLAALNDMIFVLAAYLGISP